MPDQIQTADKEKNIRRFRLPLRIICAVIIAAILFMCLINILSRPYDRTQNTYTSIIVEKSDSIEDIADKLQDSGIIESSGRFVLLNKLMFKEKPKPGMYFLSPAMSSVNIIKTMDEGLTTTDGFTIPDGYTVEQIAAALDRDGFVDENEFLRLADTFDFSEIEYIGNDLEGRDRLEGFLLPDDYSIDRNADEIMIIITMLNQFSNYFNDDYRARADELGMSMRDIVIIASMIEKETTIDSEKADISAVIHNRLNMELMEDGEFPEVPLCCPGKDSITAALYPNDNEYTHYTMSDKLDGSHVFTSDDEEYEQMVEAFHSAAEERKASREAQRKAAEASANGAEDTGTDDSSESDPEE
jgi:UPF0755 protein